MTDVVLNSVEKTFGSDRVVRSIDLRVEKGEFFSLLGPSGCGKTTTLRMIAGLETPTSGDVFIRDERMNDVPINRRPTNLVFQKAGLFPHLDVFENVAFGLRVKRMADAEIGRKVTEILQVVSLAGFERRRVTELSGGQQQRVAIARALVNEPAVLLLDEPLGALDLKLQLRLQRELKRIQRATGTTFIYVTHNQAEALTLSDRLAVMNKGQIEQIGTPADMYLKPRTSFVASFIGMTNLIEGRISRIADGWADVDGIAAPMRIDGDGAMSVGDKLTLSLRPERIAVLPRGHMDGAGLPATITEVEFQGATVIYRMRMSDGRVMLGQALADRPPHAFGDEVDIRWDPGAAVPIRATSLSSEVE